MHLLAPVPLVHLESASASGRPTAVFGTCAVDVMKSLDARGDIDLSVLFYASHSEGPVVPAATWRATFVAWSPAVGNGGVPTAWRRDRPSTTLDEDRQGGWWYAFYSVEGLHRLRDGDVVSFAQMRSAITLKRLSDVFIPEGPILVEVGDR